MVFDSTKELLTLLPRQTTTRGVNIYNAVKNFFMEEKGPTTGVSNNKCGPSHDRPRNDPDFPQFQYRCITSSAGDRCERDQLDHVMTPVIKIINRICSKTKQHRMFRMLLDKLSTEYNDLLLHTEN